MKVCMYNITILHFNTFYYKFMFTLYFDRDKNKYITIKCGEIAYSKYHIIIHEKFTNIIYYGIE